jgi:hypothetical protein
MAGFNTLIWNTKDSATAESPPIEKADEKHKRDLSRNGGFFLPRGLRNGCDAGKNRDPSLRVGMTMLILG